MDYVTPARTWLSTIRWTQVLAQPLTWYSLSLFTMVFLPIPASYLPPALQIMALTYMVWMTGWLIMGLALDARCWLVWLLGTFIWSMGWLAAVTWQLHQAI